MARGVEHHFNDAFDIAVGGLEGADINAETAGDRGADLLGVQLFAFDLAALENIGSQGFQDGFLPEVESESLHVPDQPALLVADGGREARPGISRFQWNRGQS